MWFIPAYILVLFLTIFIDYYAAIWIEESTDARIKKRHLILGVVNTCLVLFVFKYYNFFVDNLNYLGLTSIKQWELILPIGLSFHVFQSLSYVIEVYRGNIKAERNLLLYSNFVMMFPQLVAGPIERAKNLLPQLRRDTKITDKDFSVGLSRFFWGLFKKVAVADVIAQYVDAVYNNYLHHSGFTLFMASFLFAYQLYCDFSGYSDMAIGVARMMGFRFKENFRLPFFSTSMTELWKKWHISLTSWLRDYVYKSLRGNKRNKLLGYRNLILTMLIGGLWHGASWNFVIFGTLQGLYLSFEKMFKISFRANAGLIYKITGYLYVHVLISFSLIFFRCTTFAQAKYIVIAIFTDFNPAQFNIFDLFIFFSIISSLAVLLLFEYFVLMRMNFENIYRMKYGTFYLNTMIVFFVAYILLLGNLNGAQFIYFQF